jgi:peptidoglycan/xylan/chitin deacetylase (PgdA/CDA1 family)
MRSLLGLLLGLAWSLGLSAQTASPAPQREIAVTIDDLPGPGFSKADACDADRFKAQTARLLKHLTDRRVPLTAFVNEGRVCADLPAGTLEALLRLWLDAGADLGNHTYSHPSPNNVPLEEYTASIVRGETAIKKVLAERGKKLRYFRHPYLHKGNSEPTKQAIEAFLAGRGYLEAPVTADNSDWLFASAYLKAKESGDAELAGRVAATYLQYMNGVLAFFEKRSVEVVGHEVRQTLLLHSNALNADHLGSLLDVIQKRGYRFVSLDRALEDPAYQLADRFVGAQGVSWIHRWGVTKGKPIEWEPDPPKFISELAGR